MDRPSYAVPDGRPIRAVTSVEPRVREQNGLYRVYVGPYTDRDEARRVADRITTAFGMATAIAPH